MGLSSLMSTMLLEVGLGFGFLAGGCVLELPLLPLALPFWPCV